jgi:ribosome-associated translation inhibitor RaiA
MAAPETDVFDFEFYSNVDVNPSLRDEAEDRMRELADEHSDVIGASVAVEQEARGQDMPHFYRVRVVAFARPDNIAAVEKSDGLGKAFRGALDAVERQVREKREKLGEPWKRPDMQSDVGPAIE